MDAAQTNPDDARDASPLPAADDWPFATNDHDEEALQQADGPNADTARQPWPAPTEAQLVAWIAAIVDHDERVLYAAPVDRPLRPGEPLRACLIELQPGSCWASPGTGHHREWLVVRGRTRAGGDP